MNQRWNLQSSFFKSLATRSASLALLLAFSAVIGLSAPARASVVVWETGPFCDGCTLTNITFVSVEQFDAYTNSLIQSIYRASLEAETISSLVASARSHVLYADERLESALDVNDDYSVEEYITLARQQLGTYGPGRFSVMRRLDDIEASSAEITSQLSNLRSDVEAGAGETRAQVATACESDGECCCQCPDYTTYLQTIISHLSSLDVHVDTIEGILYQWNFYLGTLSNARGILPFLFNLAYGFEQFYSPNDPVSASSFLANDTAVAISNVAFTVSSLAGWSRSRDIWNATFQSGGDYYADESNPVARRLSDVWTRFLWFTEPGAPADFDNPFILGWRDFQVTKNNHPTNTADNPLWVRFNDSDSDVLSVYVNGLDDDFYSALSNLFSRLEIQVNNSLSQPSLHVTVDNTNDFSFASTANGLYNQVQNNSTIINNIANEVTGQQAEYDDPDWTLDDYGSLFDKSAEMRTWDFVGKWSKMFEDVTIEPPGPCKLWDGFAPNSGNDSGSGSGPWGGWSQIIDIQSCYWYPMESCGGLIRSIRGIFKALWTLVILFVIAALVRINWLLARCGVRILIAVFSCFTAPDPVAAVLGVFETTLKALGQLYTGLFGGRTAEEE